MKSDDRAVSVAITHSLTIAITAVLISTLLIGAGQLLDGQENRAAEEQFSEIGSDVVSNIQAIDRLNTTGADVNATVRPEYPRRIVGSSYRINVTDDNASHPFDTSYAVEIESDVLEQPVQFPLETDSTLDPDSAAQGGEVPICLDGDDEISLGVAC